MTSKREGAYCALMAALADASTGLGWFVVRNAPEPVEPEDPYCILRDGKAELEDEATLSVRSWPWADPAALELYAVQKPGQTLEALTDEFVETLEGALEDKTLGGAVDYLEIGPPEIVVDGELGTGPMLAASVIITLYYCSDRASG
jgi:hypothetical protein